MPTADPLAERRAASRGPRGPRSVLVLVLVWCTGACAPVVRAPAIPPPGAGERECVAWLARFDAQVSREAVSDAEATRVQGYPYLRANRFAQSFARESDLDGSRRTALWGYLRDLDRAARRVESANLSDGAWSRLGTDRDAGDSAVRRCADRLATRAGTDAETVIRALSLVSVPDDYSAASRALGLYPLSRLAFVAGIERWHRQSTVSFASPPISEGLRYVPVSTRPATVAEVRIWLAREARDPLGRPRLSDSDRERLFERYAPVIAVPGAAHADRIGAIRWAADERPDVDVARPLVYRRIAYTRYRGATLVQLVYTAWFPERPPRARLDPLAGPLDGTVYRVTLGDGGEVLMADAMHPCGCWHLFFPPPGTRARPAPGGLDEWAFSPAAYPRLREGQRIALDLESGTHMIVGIRAVDAPAGTGYGFAEEDGLRSLERPGGGRRSLYGPDGLVGASRRPERLLFWPMGIPSAGAMRQWGHHATAFVGRRHFDDADLLDRRFDLAPSASAPSGSGPP